MENLGYYNGEIGLLEDMKVPFLDRVSFFGDGVYDATMTNKGVILFEDDHVTRFYNSCANMGIDAGISREDLVHLLRELTAKVDAETTFLYWQVTRGTAPRSHACPDGVKANLWVMITPKPVEDLSWDATAITVEDTRFYHCDTKTLNLLPNVLAAQKAKEAGVDDAIFVRDGNVTECFHSNCHILKNGALITHPTDNLILPGIARKHLIAACKQLGVPVEERPFTLQELYDADEVIVSSSSTFARGVKEIDGRAVGCKDRELLHRLQAYLNDEFDLYTEEHISERA